MGASDYKIRIVYDGDTNQFTKAAEKATSSIQRMSEMAKIFGNVWTTQLAKARAKMIPFQGDLLSVMFLFMELKRIAFTALSSIFDAYRKLLPENDAFNQQMGILNAEWQVFKASLGAAIIENPIFQALLQWAIDIVGWFNGLNSTWKTIIATGIVLGAVIGFIGFWASFLGLGLISLYNLSLLLPVLISTLSATFAAFGGVLTVAGTAAKAFWASLGGPVTLIIGIILGAFYILSKFLQKFWIGEDNKIKGFWKNVLAGAITFGAGLVNIIILALTGVIGIFTFMYDTIIGIFKALVTASAQLGKAIWAAIKAGLTGGDWKKAFMEAFSLKDIATNFTSQFTSGATAKLGSVSKSVTDAVNNWQTNQLNKLATPTQLNTEVAAANYAGDQMGGQGTTNNFYIDSSSYTPSPDTKDAMYQANNKILKDAGLLPVGY
jgi:hypothetical protein